MKPLTQREIFYFRQRQKQRIFQLVMAHLAERGVTKGEIAILIGRNKSQVTRWFKGPGNWTFDTLSDLLLAMGAEMNFSVDKNVW